MTSASDPAAAAEPFPTSPCGTCSTPVIWAMTTNARRMPVEPALVPNGNVVLEHRAGGVLARVLGMAKRFGRNDLRVSHFVNCPQASEWRVRP